MLNRIHPCLTSRSHIQTNRCRKYSSGHTPNTVYLGLGSNMGNRLKNISHAIHALSSLDPATRLLDSSFVYQSKPMYRTDQPDFLNAACKISTPLSPQELLKLIKQIEANQGRILQNVPRNSPRPVDIDILLYNSDIIRQHDLIIPHIGIPERQFVLDPLTDMAKQFIHPEAQKSVEMLLADLLRDTADAGSVRRLHQISAPGCRTLDLTSRTHLMSIVNCTPDSFSDGGASFRPEDAVRNSLEHVSAGADILDIGGMSTRPGAADVPVETEIARTVPVIRMLRERHQVDCHISIDTFRAATAEAAVEAGATIVNDVSGGEADPDMLATVARLDVPYVLMHMRGNPRTMGQLTSYHRGDVVAGVRRELAAKVERALCAGIKRWNLIVDPGFGFAKDLAGNCRLLEGLGALRSDCGDSEDPCSLRGFPLLVGLSRKQFLARLLHHPPTPVNNGGTLPPLPGPNQRLLPTIVATTLAVRNGANLIRAHDTKTIKDVLNTVDAIRTFAAPLDVHN